jgi:hypothetical protein
MEVEEGKYQCDPSILELLLLLAHLFEHSSIPASHSGRLSTVIVHCWQLLHAKDTVFVDAIISCLTKITILPALKGYSEANEAAF